MELELALKLLSLPREVGKHPESGEPITAGIGRFGPFVQHEKTYASLEAGDEVLDIGLNRAVTLIAEKIANPGKAGASAAIPASRSASIRNAAGSSVKNGRYGAYVTNGHQRHDPERQDAGDDHARRGHRADRRARRQGRRQAEARRQEGRKAAARRRPPPKRPIPTRQSLPRRRPRRKPRRSRRQAVSTARRSQAPRPRHRRRSPQHPRRLRRRARARPGEMRETTRQRFSVPGRHRRLHPHASRARSARARSPARSA